MPADAEPGPSPDHHFPNTRWSVILQAQGSDSEVRDRALEQICRTYWLPVYAFARGQGLDPADAEDLTQNVLANLFGGGRFPAVGSERGKLRSFLRVVTKNHLRNEWKKARREKRGGGAPVVSLDCEGAERRCSLDLVDDETPERVFDRHWGLNLLERTMVRLEAAYTTEGKGAVFSALKDVLGRRGGGVNHRQIGEPLGMSEGAVKVAVHRLRKRYRRILKDEIAQTLEDPSEEAVDEEIRFLFGVFAS